MDWDFASGVPQSVWWLSVSGKINENRGENAVPSGLSMEISKNQRTREPGQFDPRSDINGDVHTGGKIELFKLIHRLCSGFDNVDHSLVGALFKLVHGLLVDVR